jgi:hypothetical protein
VARKTDADQSEPLDLGQEQVSATTVDSTDPECLDGGLGQDKMDHCVTQVDSTETDYLDEALEQEEFANETAIELESRKPHGLGALQTLQNEPVSVIPGSENILSALRAYKPSIKS